MDRTQTRSALGLALLASGAFVSPASATLIYDTWVSNDSATANYVVTVTENASFFDVHLTIEPWNAEALGFFVDLGNRTISDKTVQNVTPTNQVSLIANDTTATGCGPGCNLMGLFNAPVPEWEWVFRLGENGWNNIQTFSFSFARNGASEADWGIVGLRAQQLCPAGTELPGGIESCDGSDKSYGYSTPTQVPEPGALSLLAVGLLGLGFARRRRPS
jgi:hypothetical protein